MMKTITRVLCLLCLLNISMVIGDDQCACKIDMISLTADCKDLGIKNLTKTLKCIPHNIKSILLPYNLINDIPDNVFLEFTILTLLRLNNNDIEYIHDNAFNGLGELKELSLVANHLQHVDSFSKYSFKPLLKLQILHIEGNCEVHAKNCSYPDEALSQIRSLEHLSIDGVPYVNFGDGFSKLSRLTSLSLERYKYGYCLTPLLTEATFSAFKTTPLSVVTIDECDIHMILPNTFKAIRNLTKLVIIGNEHLCVDAIDNATLGLNQTNIRHIEFTHWCNHTASSLRLAEGSMQGLKNTSLLSFVLEYDHISYIYPECIDNFPISLKYLSIKGNTISSFHFTKYLYKLENLLTFDMSYQNIITSVHNVMAASKNTERKKNVQMKTSMLMNVTSENVFLIPRNLRLIQMDYVKLSRSIPSFVVSSDNDLRCIYARGCLFLSILGPCIGLDSLEVIDLSENLILKYVHPKSFIGMPNLRDLYLDNNQLGMTIMEDTQCETFSRQRNLEILTLDQTEIKELPYLIFDNLVSMRNLSISRNSMEIFNVKLSSMSKLRHLDLSSNEIVDISPENRMTLDQIATDNDMYLDLSDNIMLCQCEYIDFITWLATTRVIILGRNDLKCRYSNNTIVNLANIDEIVYLLKYECSALTVVITCVSFFVISTTLSFSFAVIYQKRWQFRYLYYMGRNNLNLYHPLEETEIEVDTDVYISFETHFQLTENVDLHTFIRDTLYPRLTADRFNVKIRDDLLGNLPFFKVIPTVIRKSRRVVVFLTLDYLNDYWNVFEFHMAVLEGIYTKRNILLPIMVGDSLNIDKFPEIYTCIQAKIEVHDFMSISKDMYVSLTQSSEHQDEFITELEKKLRL
ncbi:toll-like receptor 4 [Mactra antiquata]